MKLLTSTRLNKRCDFTLPEGVTLLSWTADSTTHYTLYLRMESDGGPLSGAIDLPSPQRTFYPWGDEITPVFYGMLADLYEQCPADFRYQWVYFAKDFWGDLSRTVPIDGETGPTYTPDKTMIGKNIGVIVEVRGYSGSISGPGWWEAKHVGVRYNDQKPIAPTVANLTREGFTVLHPRADQEYSVRVASEPVHWDDTALFYFTGTTHNQTITGLEPGVTYRLETRIKNTEYEYFGGSEYFDYTVPDGAVPLDYSVEIDESSTDVWEGTYWDGNDLHLYVKEGGKVLLLYRPSDPTVQFVSDTLDLDYFISDLGTDFDQTEVLGNPTYPSYVGYLHKSYYDYDSEKNALAVHINAGRSTLERLVNPSTGKVRKDFVLIQPRFAIYDPGNPTQTSTRVYVHVYDSLDNIVPRAEFEETPPFSTIGSTVTTTLNLTPAIYDNISFEVVCSGKVKADDVTVSMRGDQVSVTSVMSGQVTVYPTVNGHRLDKPDGSTTASLRVSFQDKAALECTANTIKATVNYDGQYYLACTHFDSDGRLLNVSMASMDLKAGTTGNILNAPFRLGTGDKVMLLDKDYKPITAAVTVA